MNKRVQREIHEAYGVIRANASRSTCRSRSDISQQDDRKNDQDDETQTARVIAPTGAIWPGRQRAEDQQQKNDENQEAHGFLRWNDRDGCQLERFFVAFFAVFLRADLRPLLFFLAPPPSVLLTVAHARFCAVFLETPLRS